MNVTPEPRNALLPDTICFLNGDYTALKDAKISVMDRGFIFGDGVYEVLPVYAGQVFRFDQHVARLGPQPGRAAHHQSVHASQMA